MPAAIRTAAPLVVLFALPLAAQEPDSAATEDLLRQARHQDRLAEGHHRGRRLRPAIAAAEQALALYERARGKEHLDVAAALNRLGRLHVELGEYRHAGPYLERALRIRQGVLPAMHPDLATSHNNLAAVYEQAGKYTEAAEHLAAALEVFEITLEPQDPRRARALQHVARVYVEAGDYERAAPLLAQAIEILQQGGRGPQAARAAMHLADLHARRGDHERAVAVALGATLALKKGLGERSAPYGVALNALGTLLDQAGRPEEAFRAYAKAFDVLVKQPEPDQTLLGSVTNNLALSFERQGKYEDAKKMFAAAYKLLREAGETAGAAAILSNLASLHRKLEQYAAIRIWPSWRATSGRSSPPRATSSAPSSSRPAGSGWRSRSWPPPWRRARRTRRRRTWPATGPEPTGRSRSTPCRRPGTRRRGDSPWTSCSSARAACSTRSAAASGRRATA
ncbi:MAG: tetratricopeptide repeat protein [Planctomycetota bacterium]